MVLTGRMSAEDWKQDDDFVPLTYEKVVGLNNLLSISWLTRGLELAAPVARILTLSGVGTGFLVANDILLTCNHVLPDERTIAQASAQFNYEIDWSGAAEPTTTATLDVSHFRTNEALDYTLVRVNDSPGQLYGFVDLTVRAEPAVNDFVTVIQQPEGGYKQICLTDNKVSSVFGNVVQYSTDTEPGSSGSPVFNQNWQLVALHHAGGGLAGPDGTKFFTNEGIRITEIVRDAASFLGITDTLYTLAFGNLRSALVRLVAVPGAADQLDATAVHLVRTTPRFPQALKEWIDLNGVAGESDISSAALVGLAVGGALRQWARTTGHESIPSVPAVDPAPGDDLVRIIGAYQGSNSLPADVYAGILTAIRPKMALVQPVVALEKNTGITVAARAFLRGVLVGAKAFESAATAGTRSKPRTRSHAKAKP
jgi:V8-like Glu-specific endopeptidase